MDTISSETSLTAGDLIKTLADLAGVSSDFVLELLGRACRLPGPEAHQARALLVLLGLEPPMQPITLDEILAAEEDDPFGLCFRPGMTIEELSSNYGLEPDALRSAIYALKLRQFPFFASLCTPPAHETVNPTQVKLAQAA